MGPMPETHRDQTGVGAVPASPPPSANLRPVLFHPHPLRRRPLQCSTALLHRGLGVLHRVLGVPDRVLGCVTQGTRGTTQGTRGATQGTRGATQGTRGTTQGIRGATQGARGTTQGTPSAASTHSLWHGHLGWMGPHNWTGRCPQPPPPPLAPPTQPLGRLAS